MKLTPTGKITKKYKKKLLEKGLRYCNKCRRILNLNNFCSYYSNCIECSKERKRLYRHNHPEMYSPKTGGISKRAFEKIKEAFKWRCAECDECEPFFGQYWIWLVQDHIYPKSKGGAKYRKSNIQPLCWDCNNKKSDKI